MQATPGWDRQRDTRGRHPGPDKDRTAAYRRGPQGLPVDLAWRARKAAEARGIPTTALMREWIAAGLDLAEAGQHRDPVTELHAIADAANRALRVLETQQRHAA